MAEQGRNASAASTDVRSNGLFGRAKTYANRVKWRAWRVLRPISRPNFFLVGAGKSGTTTLHRWLSSHPQIYFPRLKEPNYYTFLGEDPATLEPLDRDYATRCITTARDYERLYQAVAGETIIGDASPLYLYHPRVASRIHSDVPNAKILIVLRNPLERAYSDYRMHVRHGREDRDFRNSISEDQGTFRLLVGCYAQKSLYADQVIRYLELFGRENVLITLFDDLENDPRAMMASIFAFLGIDDRFECNIAERLNVAPDRSIPTICLSEIQMSFERDISRLEQIAGLDLGCWLGRKEKGARADIGMPCSASNALGLMP